MEGEAQEGHFNDGNVNLRSLDPDWREKAELLEYSEGWRRDLLLRMNTQPHLLFPVLFRYKFILFFDAEKHLHGFKTAGT